MAEVAYGDKFEERTGRDLGFPISKTFFLFENGTTLYYRENEKWFNKFPQQLKDALASDAGFQKIKTVLDKTGVSLELLRGLKNGGLMPNRDTLSLLCNEIKSGIPGMILAYWIPIFQTEGIVEIEEIEYFEKVRKGTEEYFSTCVESCFLLLDEINDKCAGDFGLLKYATVRELEDSIDNAVLNRAELEKRSKTRFLFVDDEIFIGSKAMESKLQEWDYRLAESDMKNSATLTGVAAYGGIVKGRVRIILSRDQFASFNAGEILVTPMTSPSYLFLLKVAGAIVTDEGGMLSHAAIVARELNKPCIIGTRIATKVLKDGDQVEVDADHGIVRKL